ncbi:MAG: TlpA family protein disulfide reductase [Verrucomicrobia bacterium]|nr:TlpA family protein disulfide reductase [Verrucomicrobiota bacterium]NBU08685.1 TlpA family protein disulfide reductase [Pseudomonadota bacterium]NDA65409.1 TlpA family protein disulfide reductase [Verrucomicrobiota bacterium]NDB76232.1 TlpA family protein disulfide reductase [Verrucomicrobiota bacterium]NDD37218.1 TlpA family protein disulfide reductase [Verrucomicrobiota bacterium]
MKKYLHLLVIALSLLLSASLAQAGDAKEELQTLVGKIRTKLKDGKNTEKDLAENFGEFDKLLAAHKGEKTDDVAQILMMKAMLYLQVLDDEAKGLPLLTLLKKDFPDTKPAAAVDQILKSMETQKASKEIQRKLVVGAKFPDFEEKDLAGKPLSIANYKGKVVLVDFWATWCGPCVGELPNVLKAYEKHHGKGFEIVGISLDSDRAKLDKFIADRKMTWAQYYDGKGWQNKLAGTYGVNSIPATYLLDGEGKIIAKNLRGEALEEAVAKALAKK